MATTGADRKIDYIEFNVADITAAKAFYGTVFDRAFTDYCEFQDGCLTGGFAKADTVTARGGALVILFAEDLDEALVRVENAGGTIVKPIYTFPGGRRFHFIDPAGYELAIWSDT